MNASAHSYQVFVGVDIAAVSFAASWCHAGAASRPARSFSQTPDGFPAFQAALASTGVAPEQTLIVLEATGSYWISLAVTLHQSGYVVSVVNPAHVHAFARSLPRRAKTDALDAALLVQFAFERLPERWTPPEQVYHELRQRLLVATLNFQACRSAEAATANAGLVPLARESGTSVRGRRQIGHAGHARLRTALYLASLSAARHNPLIRAQYQRLRAAGKPTKVARCACARKLLQLAYAVVRKGERFDPDYRTRGTTAC